MVVRVEGLMVVCIAVRVWVPGLVYNVHSQSQSVTVSRVQDEARVK